MARLLAIDYGLKRVGLAVTDPDQIIATPLEAVSARDLIPYLTKYMIVNPVETIVLGYPRKLDNSDTNITQQVYLIAENLRRKFTNVNIILHDERFTSSMAMDAMIKGGTRKKDRRNKANIDKISATIILQSYMEQRSISKR